MREQSTARSLAVDYFLSAGTSGCLALDF